MDGMTQILDLSHDITPGMSTGLGAVPARGATLHAAPLAWHGVGTWPVRAYATVQ
jgi:kynurenine formamidase